MSICNSVFIGGYWSSTTTHHIEKHFHEMWRLPTKFLLSYNLLLHVSLTRSRRAWTEQRFCPSQCLISLAKAHAFNTNLNDSAGNLGSLSEAGLGLAWWPSLREHGKFGGSICQSRCELENRTRRAVIKWVRSKSGFGGCQAKVCGCGCTVWLSLIVSGGNVTCPSKCTEERWKERWHSYM